MKSFVCFNVAGTRHYSADALRVNKVLAPGLVLKLEHEPHNKFDPNAVAIRVSDSGDMLGHVPRERAASCVELIRSQRLLAADVSKVSVLNGNIGIGVRLTVKKDACEARAHLYVPPKPPNFRYMPYGGAFYEPPKYSKLSKMFGNAVGDLRDAFLSLSNSDRELIFADYTKHYGERSAEYARKTYQSWKYGRVKLSGQTMERIMNLVPPRLPADVRLSLLRSILSKNRNPRPPSKIEIDRRNPSVGLQHLETALASMSHRDVLAFLPATAMEAATWLYDDDVTAARAMLAQAERQENDMLRGKAANDISMLKTLISTRTINEANYRIELPTGILDVTVVEPGVFSRIASLVSKRR